ncbi:MAG: DUF1080 domain-containing protein [Planctomycetes bacterium]|nr:DUF1080 domain-containing protein [Planctomycetota bacterium]
MDRTRPRGYTRIGVLFAGLLAGCASSGAARWAPLFDGETLSGFHTIGNAEWIVEGGEIVGRQGKERPRGGWLVTDRTFRDVEIELDFQTSYWANSGVVVRDPKGCTGSPYRDGYEVQILNRSDDRFPTGSVYGQASAPYGLHREREWNRLRIVATGSSIHVFLNGEEACAVPEGVRADPGAIGLQVSSGRFYRDMWVRFRRIRVRDLVRGTGKAEPPAKAETPPAEEGKAEPPAKAEGAPGKAVEPEAAKEAPPAKEDAPAEEGKAEPPKGEEAGKEAPPPPPPPPS